MNKRNVLIIVGIFLFVSVFIGGLIGWRLHPVECVVEYIIKERTEYGYLDFAVGDSVWFIEKDRTLWIGEGVWVGVGCEEREIPKEIRVKWKGGIVEKILIKDTLPQYYVNEYVWYYANELSRENDSIPAYYEKYMNEISHLHEKIGKLW